MIDEPWGAFMYRSSIVLGLSVSGLFHVDHQDSRYWPILTRFVDYYSPFSCTKAISIVVEPRGALTCRSSTLAVLANSSLFLGL